MSFIDEKSIDFKVLEGLPEWAVQIQQAMDGLFLKNPETGGIFMWIEDKGYICCKCAEQANSLTRRYEKLWDLKTRIGPGEWFYQEGIPFCPKCDEKPARQGEPILIPKPDFVDQLYKNNELNFGGI